jgi:DNA-binding MurR/RpiR family transcriptional regulator
MKRAATTTRSAPARRPRARGGAAAKTAAPPSRTPRGARGAAGAGGAGSAPGARGAETPAPQADPNGAAPPAGNGTVNAAEAAPAKRQAQGAEQSPAHQTLSTYIQSRFEECSRSQKDVAQYIVDHLDEAAFQTAEELARRANTSSSTVVRFSQALGFEGFPELQAAAREEYRRVHAQPAPDASGGPLFALDPTEFEAAMAADHANVEETGRKLSRSAVDTAVDAITEAEKVLIAGTDQMAFFASYLRHLLMLLDLRADIVASPSQEALSRLGRIDETTLLIGLSAGRPHPLVVRAMKLARHRKATTAAITDATLSEVARLAQIKLYYSSNGPAFVRSHTALLSVIQALAYGVYSRDAAQYADRIKAFRLK